jgi:hypothetical protein
VFDTTLSRRLATRVAACVAVMAALTHALVALASSDLDRIMRALAAQPAGSVRFVEARTSALLREPIRAEGTLTHGADGRLEKHTLKPREERLVVAGGTVTVERPEHGRFSMRLADQPGAQALIEGLRGTLTGDLAALQRHYRVELQGGFEEWRLFLLPRDAQMAELVSNVRVAGTRGEVREVEIREASGDRSVLTLTKAPR